ncbi:MAG: hypothetical protein QW566_03335 [Candidatus Jordarchaeales archaeon]
MKDSVREENALQAYGATKRMLETAEKLKNMLKMVPEVRDFLGLSSEHA